MVEPQGERTEYLHNRHAERKRHVKLLAATHVQLFACATKRLCLILNVTKTKHRTKAPCCTNCNIPLLQKVHSGCQ